MIVATPNILTIMFVQEVFLSWLTPGDWSVTSPCDYPGTKSPCVNYLSLSTKSSRGD